MTREEIARFFTRRQDAWKQHDLETLVLDHSEDCVVDSPAGGKVKGRAAIEKIYRGFLLSFPDLAFTGAEYIVDGDRAVQMSTMTGTNKGGFMDVPPTGKRISIPIVSIFKFKNGQIVEEKHVYDFTGVLVQAGVLKAKPS